MNLTDTPTLRGRTIVVTGANGFIGSHVVPQLRAEGATVVALGGPRATGETIAVDLAQPLLSLPLPEHIDGFVHLAADTDPHSPPERLQTINVQASLRLLALAQARGARHFVFASTGGVYGFSDTPLTEDAPTVPLNTYSASKLEAEKKLLAASGSTKVIVLRLFFPYGSAQPGRLMNRIAETIRNGDAVEMHRDGATPILNPIHVDDVVEAVLRSLFVGQNTVINVAGTEAVPFSEIAATIARVVGKPLRTKPAQGQEPQHMIADITRMRTTLALTPKIGLGEGISKALHHE